MTGPLFALRRPDDAAVERFLARQRALPLSYPEVGVTRDPPERLAGYARDHHRVRLGDGEERFARAAALLAAWRPYALGWVEVRGGRPEPDEGSVACVVARHLGFWSLNAVRIVERTVGERAASFTVGTLPGHLERGEERFRVALRDDGSVWYDILAFSQPSHWASRLGAPYARATQRRFARRSLRAMAAGMRGGP